MRKFKTQFKSVLGIRLSFLNIFTVPTSLVFEFQFFQRPYTCIFHILAALRSLSIINTISTLYRKRVIDAHNNIIIFYKIYVSV